MIFEMTTIIQRPKVLHNSTHCTSTPPNSPSFWASLMAIVDADAVLSKPKSPLIGKTRPILMREVLFVLLRFVFCGFAASMLVFVVLVFVRGLASNDLCRR